MAGRTYDLKSAYKQFPLASFDRELLKIAVNCPGHPNAKLMGTNVLPFGAVGSVLEGELGCVVRWFASTIHILERLLW